MVDKTDTRCTLYIDIPVYVPVFSIYVHCILIMIETSPLFEILPLS